MIKSSEHLKEVFLKSFWDSAARVFDWYGNGGFIRVFYDVDNYESFFGKFDGISDEINKDLFKSSKIIIDGKRFFNFIRESILDKDFSVRGKKFRGRWLEKEILLLNTWLWFYNWFWGFKVLKSDIFLIGLKLEDFKNIFYSFSNYKFFKNHSEDSFSNLSIVKNIVN
jgi:hypothetical protein